MRAETSNGSEAFLNPMFHSLKGKMSENKGNVNDMIKQTGSYSNCSIGKYFIGVALDSGDTTSQKDRLAVPLRHTLVLRVLLCKALLKIIRVWITVTRISLGGRQKIAQANALRRLGKSRKTHVTEKRYLETLSTHPWVPHSSVLPQSHLEIMQPPRFSKWRLDHQRLSHFS